ncbi:MAG: flippase [Methanomicrobia archaeon]|nr:flippase [Methanomicrobia archaeon]
MNSANITVDNSLRKVAKGTGIGFIGFFIGAVFGYFSRIILARFLGATDYGLISLGFAAMSLTAAVSLVGLQGGVTRYVAFYKGRGDKGGIKGTIEGAVKIALPLSLIFTFSLFSGSQWISINVFHEPHLTSVLRIFSIAVPFFSLSIIFVAAIAGFQDMRYVAYVDQVFQNTLKLVAIVALLVLGFGVLGAAWGWALAIIAMPFLGFYFLEKKVFPVLNTPIKATSLERELLSFSWPLLFATLSAVVMNWTDTFMLGYFSSAQEVGIYNAAHPTAALIYFVFMSFSGIFMPVISELHARNRSDELKITYSAVTKWILSLALPAFLLITLFSRSVITILFGDEFITGSTALAILAFGYIIQAMLGLSGRIIQALGRTKIILVCNVIGAASNVGLNLYLIPLYGINGAAVATALSIILMIGLIFTFAYRISGMQPFKFSHLKPVITSIIAVLIVYGITKYAFVVSFLVLIAMLPVFFVLYFILLLVVKGFDKEDVMIMRAIDQRLGIKLKWIRKIISRFI